MGADDTVLALHRHTGEVAHMLVGAGELVEERRLAAVLVADEAKGDGLSRGNELCDILLRSGFAQTGVLAVLNNALCVGMVEHPCLVRHIGNLDPGGVILAQGQFVTAHANLHRAGNILDICNFCAGSQAHIQNMFSKRNIIAVYRVDQCCFSSFQLIQCHRYPS